MADEKSIKFEKSDKASTSYRQSETQQATKSDSDEVATPRQPRQQDVSDRKPQINILISLLVLPIFAFVLINAVVTSADYLINGSHQLNLDIQLVESISFPAGNDPNNASVLFADADLFDLNMLDLYETSFSPDEKTGQSQKTDAETSPSVFEHAFRDKSVVEKYVNLEPENTTSLQPETNGSYVRLGDTVYRDLIDPDIINGKRINSPTFFAVIGSNFSSGGHDSLSFALDDAGKKQVLESSIRLSLLKADDLGLNKITFYAIQSSEFPTELWRDSIQNLTRTEQDYLANIENIEFIIKTPTTDLESVSESFGGISTLLKRRLFLRTPIANQEQIFPLRIGATPLANEDTKPSTTQYLDQFQKRVFLPNISTATSFIILPLMLAYVAFLLAATASIAQAVHLKQQLRSQWNDPLKLVIAAMVPLAYAALTWVNWSQPINWQPNSVPNQLPSSVVYALMIGTGVISGRLTLRQAFEDIPDVEPVTKDEPSRIKSSLINDNPVSNWREGDRLGFSNVVLALASLFDNRNTLPPLVASVNGPWGSGKSSIMRMLETQLTETQRFHFAWFNAWQYRNENEILQAFLRTLASQLRKDLGPSFKLRMAWIRWKNASDLTRLGYIAPFLALAAVAFFPSIDLDPATLKGTIFDGMNSAGLITIFTAIFGLFGIGGTINSIRWLKPFQKPLMELLSNTAASTNESHIDHFNREFQLFREAVGEKKFLIFIDDLDRCPPESVVEVLKAINLIATSSDGAGKTFFLLGFDWHYVLTTIELHFKELMAKSSLHNDGNFGHEYLKKIVTLPISVPKPSRKQIKSMVTTLDNADTSSPSEDAPEKSWLVRLQQTVLDTSQKLLEFLSRPLNVIVLVCVLSAVVYYSVPQDATTVPEKAIITDTPPSTRPGGTGTNTDNVEQRTPDVVLSPPTNSVDTGFGSNVIVYVALGLLLLFLLVFFTKQFAMLRLQKYAPPEPQDPAAFTKAVEALADRMPENPRDIIRAVNTMRVAYLVQTPGQFNYAPATSGHSASHDIFSGIPFTPAQSTRLSLWYYRFGHILDIRMIEDKLLPELRKKDENLSQFLKTKNTAGYDEEFANWLSAFSDSLKKFPKLKADINNPNQFQRFVDIYRHLLKINSTTPKSDSNETTDLKT